MGCNIEYLSIRDNGNLNRTFAEEMLNDRLESEGGLPQRIRWIDSISPFSGFEEAKEFVENQYGCHDRYACVAVRFYKAEPEDLKADKQYTELVSRMNSLRKKHDGLMLDPYIKTLKSKTLTCKNCGCVIPVAHWDSNHCPVCHTDLRPASLKERLSKITETLNQMDERIAERSIFIARKKGKVCWMIRTAYHS